MSNPISMVDLIDSCKKEASPSYADLLNENTELKKEIGATRHALEQIRWVLDTFCSAEEGDQI